MGSISKHGQPRSAKRNRREKAWQEGPGGESGIAGVWLRKKAGGGGSGPLLLTQNKGKLYANFLQVYSVLVPCGQINSEITACRILHEEFIFQRGT